MVKRVTLFSMLLVIPRKIYSNKEEQFPLSLLVCYCLNFWEYDQENDTCTCSTSVHLQNIIKQNLISFTKCIFIFGKLSSGQKIVHILKRPWYLFPNSKNYLRKNIKKLRWKSRCHSWGMLPSTTLLWLYLPYLRK